MRAKPDPLADLHVGCIIENNCGHRYRVTEYVTCYSVPYWSVVPLRGQGFPDWACAGWSVELMRQSGCKVIKAYKQMALNI